MLLSYVQLILGLSIPHTLVRIWLVFAAAGLRPTRHARKLILFAVVSSVADFDYWLVPAPVHAITATSIAFVALYAVFRTFGSRSVLLLFVAYTATSFLADIAGGALIQLLYGMTDRKDIIANHPLVFHSVYVPLGIALGLLALYLEKRSYPFLLRLYQYLLDIQQSRMKEVMLLIIVQLFVVGLLFSIGMESEKRTETSYNWTVYALVLLTFCAIYFMLRLFVRIREDAISQTRDVYAEEIGQMFTAIRGHRHDFLNHMQVMSSMLQMNKLEQLKGYMDDLAKETHAVAPVVSHSSPALAAFISGKTEQAKAKDIPFDCDIPADPELEQSIKMIDLVKIIGNLVDNAFEESETIPPHNRSVRMAIRSEGERLALEISNRGRPLSDKELRMMAVPGYTTKKAGHSGLGLAIVQERVRFYGGTLSIRYCPENETTAIVVELPRNKAREADRVRV
ncbi:sensor histidine kinase [Cohnella phaseoli]|uniref:Sensor kinase SpoOB-type protein n=1 Tax=Cohnella phaseoli TaxID=456490 RepID=A0A3D9JNH9_9BACL|nr:ATP-binding protein [Cohnella phaseoli]RED75574.1 sensor kinase SpoOB-type protein [Cohnella phaseoli]